MDSFLSDETTPLLIRTTRLPSLAPTIARIRDLQVDQIHVEGLYPGQPLDDNSIQVAFTLAVLLELRRMKLKPSAEPDLYQAWHAKKLNGRDAQTLEKQITDIWVLHLTEYRSTHDIEAVLWTVFPTEDGESESHRVIDFLVHSDAPETLTSHPLIMSSLQHTWRRGRNLSSESHAASTGWLTRYDALCTPQASHFIDWVSHLLYLVLLSSYLIDPIQPPHTWGGWVQSWYGPRELLLILFSLSFLAQPRSFTNVSSSLTPLAFILSPPSVPHPGNNAFSILQWAFMLHVFGLISPSAPSHFFLLSHHHSLSLAGLLSQGVSKILSPVLILFIPLFVFSFYLLSVSMADTFLQAFASGPFSAVMAAAPVETRFTFLVTSLAVFALLLASVFILATTLPSLPHTEPDPWDQYSRIVGLKARKAFIRADISYAGLYIFPPPFNIARILFIQVPSIILKLFTLRTSYMATLERILWRFTVGPLMVLVALLFWRPVYR